MRCPAVFLVKNIVLNSTRCDHYDLWRSLLLLFTVVVPATLNVMQFVSGTRLCHMPAVLFVSKSDYFAFADCTAEYAP